MHRTPPTAHSTAQISAPVGRNRRANGAPATRICGAAPGWLLSSASGVPANEALTTALQSRTRPKLKQSSASPAVVPLVQPLSRRAIPSPPQPDPPTPPADGAAQPQLPEPLEPPAQRAQDAAAIPPAEAVGPWAAPEALATRAEADALCSAVSAAAAWLHHTSLRC